MGAASVTFKHVPDGAAQAVVAGKGADTVAYDLTGGAGTHPLLVTVICKVQQIAAFPSSKHLRPSGVTWIKGAHKMVNILLKGRTMEAGYA